MYVVHEHLKQVVYVSVFHVFTFWENRSLKIKSNNIC